MISHFILPGDTWDVTIVTTLACMSCILAFWSHFWYGCITSVGLGNVMQTALEWHVNSRYCIIHCILFTQVLYEMYTERVTELGPALYVKSLIAEWLEKASQWHEVYCHDLGVVSSNLLSQVVLELNILNKGDFVVVLPQIIERMLICNLIHRPFFIFHFPY